MMIAVFGWYSLWQGLSGTDGMRHTALWNGRRKQLHLQRYAVHVTLACCRDEQLEINMVSHTTFYSFVLILSDQCM
jgi:hypothetical protein